MESFSRFTIGLTNAHVIKSFFAGGRHWDIIDYLEVKPVRIFGDGEQQALKGISGP